MSTIGLLSALLVIAYVGGFLVGGRAVHGVGLPSGSEYLLLGFIFGPTVFGVADTNVLGSFAPLCEVALAWLALVRGLEFGPFGKRAVKKRWIFFTSLLGILSALLVGWAVYLVMVALDVLTPKERLMVAGGLGAAAGESPRLVVRWVVERKGAHGPLTELIGDLAEGDQLTPLTLVAVLFALDMPAGGPIALPPMAWFGITIGLGVVLGILAGLLLGRKFDAGEAWGVLLGTSLVAIGLSAAVGLSPMTTAFFLGVALTAVSPHREELQAMTKASERPVLLPALLLAGARVGLDLPPLLIAVAGAAIGARMMTKLFAARMIGSLLPESKPAWVSLGAGLSSAGPLALSIGLAYSLRFPGAVGAVVLVGTALSALVGEFVGPIGLEAALRSAHEIPDVAVVTSEPEVVS